MRDFRRFIKGIKFKDNNDGPNAIGDLSGSLTTEDNGAIYNYQNRIKAYLDNVEREIITNDQTQTLTNKTIDADNNTISNIETDNLKAGVLVTDISAATSDTEIPSALAVKNAVDAQNEASEITYDNSTSGLTATQVQAAIDEVEGRLDTAETNISTGSGDLSAHVGASSGVHGVTGNVVGDTDTQTLTNKTLTSPTVNGGTLSNASIETPIRSDVKQDTDANLVTYAATATNGQLCFATDTKLLYQVVDSALVAIGATSADNISYSNTTSGLTATDVQAAIDEVEGRVDTAESGLSTHIADTSVHGVTGDVVGTTDSQTLSNKSINSSDINLGTASNSSKLVVSSDTKTNLDGLTRESGSLYYATDQEKYFGDNGTDLIELGSGGSGLKNYIENPGAELNLDGYATYVDASSDTPVDGTGGSANITLTRNTSSPLSGDADFIITKDGVNRQGEGVSYDFTIDRADQARILRISFDYNTSINYDDADVRLFVYDVTNSKIIQVVDRDLSGSTFGRYLGEFQSSPDSTSYRIIFHIATTNAASYEINFDNLQVGPRDVSTGNLSVVAVTAAGNNGGSVTSTTNINFTEVTDTFNAWDGSVFTVPETGYYEFSGAVLITSSLSGPSINLFVDGTFNRRVNDVVGSTTFFTINHTTIYLEVGQQVSFRLDQSATLANATGNHYLNITKLRNANVSNDFNNTPIVFELQKTSNQSLTNGASTVLTLQQTNIDTVGGADLSGNKYIIPESGLYSITATASYSANSNGNRSAAIVVNGVSNFLENNNATPNPYPTRVTGTKIFDLQKGDEIQLMGLQASGGNLNAASPSSLSGFKIQSPETLIGSEIVAARCTSDGGQSISGTLEYENVDYDTHNSYNISTGIYTVPVSGKYRVTATYRTNSGTWSFGNSVFLTIRKNGTAIHQANVVTGSGTTQYSAQIFTEFEVVLGDEISIAGSTSLTSNMTTDNNDNVLTISKIK